MGPPAKPFCLFSLIFLILFDILAESAPDYSALVFKGCSKQDLADPTGAYSQARSTVLGTLVSQSTKVKFYKANAGGGQTAFSGLFQCRGDLSNADCYSCVSNLPTLLDKLCGQSKAAARIQLYGCSMHYEVAGFAQVSGMEMLYKACGSKNVGGSGFEERRDTALSALESGVGGGGNGFYATTFESVYAVAQCEGDLGSADCGECVKSAVQRSQVECGSAVSGQMYLNKCFIGYNYYRNGVPKNPSSSSSSSSYSSPSEIVFSADVSIAVHLS
ncbi:plasmodesmata-located protein 2 isoform X2 [Malania oleifera]|uniref:plasmodesmata-located protein 2 isoform X2 n=1 Tax=Malania oleifera TaxID=397392 RepID=UPI0025AE78DB|nr:plasmodesmata-located protein 2 isoform X2 [Malania oleifera]